MPSNAATAKLEVSGLGLGKQKMQTLFAKAKRLGLSPQRYVRQLVEQDLAIESDAQSMTLAEIMAPVRKEFGESGMTEGELDTMVKAVRGKAISATPPQYSGDGPDEIHPNHPLTNDDTSSPSSLQ